MRIEERDHYAVLGVPPDATGADIRKAYLRQMLDHHPDRVKAQDPQADELVRHLTEAYDSLRDPARRREYDERLSEQTRREGRQEDDGPGQ